MRNTSRCIRTHLPGTDNVVFICVNIESPASFSERFYFLFGNNHVASSSLPLSYNSQPRVSIPPVSLFRFPSRNRRRIVCHQFLHMFHLCVASKLAPRNGPRQNQGLYLRTYSIVQWKNKRRASACDVGK